MVNLFMTGVSHGLIAIGVFFLFLGVYGLFKYEDFYTRVLVASKIDTVGFLLIAFGFIIRHGFSFFSGKLALMIGLMIILNPFVAVIVVRSAFADNAMKHPEGAECEDLPLSEKELADCSLDGPWV